MLILWVDMGGDVVLVEKKMQKLLDKLSRSIQADADILDITGMVVASSKRERMGRCDDHVRLLFEKKYQNSFFYKGRTFMKFTVDKTLVYYISMPGTDRIVRNYCFLLVSLLEAYLKTDTQKMNREQVMKRAILEQSSDLEFREAVRNYKIEEEVERCVFVIQTKGMEAEDIYKIFLKAFSKNQGDFLILVDSRTVALIKVIADEMEESEFVQLAAAIDETIMNETSIKANIGIGSLRKSIYDISKSYKEAVKAIQIGSIYDSSSRIHVFDDLLLERFLHEVPIKISQKFYQKIFNDEFSKVFNDEMIITIEKFFENSLNLSETARQLYIHRNTLVYRLDKIQKVLGLDLRNFHDAVTFKIMMMLERHSRE